MKNKMRIHWLLSPLIIWGFLSAFSVAAYAHCQVPCGIYDDHARIEKMLEDTATILKADRLIAQLSGKTDALSQNQLVRWVMTKEKHAQDVISIISNYFLTQRVKENQKDYGERLKKHHAVIAAAMKVKQNPDETYALVLEKKIQALAPYYPEHKN